MFINRKVKKIISLVLTILIIGYRSPVVFAYDPPTAPSVPSAASQPETPSIPENTNPQPTPPEQPEAPVAPAVEEALNPSPTPTPEPVNNVPDDNQDQSEADTTNENQTENVSETTEPSDIDNDQSSTPQNESNTGGQIQDGVNNDPKILTGDAISSTFVKNDANGNILTSPSDNDASIKVANSENGSDSTNTGSVKISDSKVTVQDNKTGIVNDIIQESKSGENSVSYNYGNAEIKTGDANTSSTVINSVNTNIDGIAYAEFNIVDDQVGDVVLDFNTGCVSGCESDSIEVANFGNGQDSENFSEVELSDNNLTFQANDAVIENNINLASNSGDNQTNDNTKSDTSIETGDANVAANVVNFVNNNIAGGIIYTVVNIFGDLIGNIILPDDYFSGNSNSSSVTAENSGNLANSNNNSSVNSNEANEIYQFNSVEIDNNLILVTNTGENQLKDNTQGSISLETGDTNVEANIVNVANTNVVGENMWLVIINEAGKWIGKILGAPDDASLAGSEGFEFILDDNGEITAVNSGNGEESQNNAEVDVNNSNITVQENNAKIVNNLNLSANTGRNEASGNTGGDNSIKTGDANIVANIVNFVNNNIVGGGKLFVTVVNVFGSWVGDFLGPGYSQEADNSNNDADDAGIGGNSNPENTDIPSDNYTASASSNDGGGSDSGNSSSLADNSTPTPLFDSGGEILAQAAIDYQDYFSFGESEESTGQTNSEPEKTNPSAEKSININLAWALPIVPFGILLARRRRLLR